MDGSDGLARRMLRKLFSPRGSVSSHTVDVSSSHPTKFEDIDFHVTMDIDVGAIALKLSGETGAGAGCCPPDGTTDGPPRNRHEIVGNCIS